MTDRAAAARPGCAGLRCCQRGVHVTPGCHRQARGSRPASASAWFVPERVCRYRGLPSLVKSPRAHRLWVSLIDGSGPESRLDIFTVNVRLIYELLRRGVWTIPLSSPSTGVWTAFSHAKALLQAWPRQHNPQHFPNARTGSGPFCTSDPHGCAQQSRQEVLLPGWQAAALQRAGACVRNRHAHAVPGLGPDKLRSPTTAGSRMLTAHPADRRAASLSRPPDRQLILIRCGPRVFDTLKLPKPLVTPRRHHNRESKREANRSPSTTGSAAGQPTSNGPS